MAAYKDTERKTWYCKFRYTDWMGKSRWTTKRDFSTKSEALRFEMNFKDQSKGKADITINALCDAYLQDRKAQGKMQSYITVKRIIDKHIRPTLGEFRLSAITKRTIREWQNHLLEYKNPVTDSKLSENFLRNINRQLSTLFNYAVRFYDYPSNPLHVVGAIGKRKHSQTFLTIDQFRQLLAAIPDDYYILVFKILFFSGMRVGEFLALSLKDFNFEKNTININKTFVHYDKSITTPKTESSARIIAMPPTIMQEIKKYADSLYECPDRLFDATHKKLSWNLKKYLNAADLPPISIHDLRHSHVSYLIHSGVPITTISKRLGHKSPQITLNTYSHMYLESESDVANLLEKEVKTTAETALHDHTLTNKSSRL